MKRLAAACLILLTGALPAEAHSAARGFVLLLPVNLVIAAGAAAVLLSFLVLSALPDRFFAGQESTTSRTDTPSVIPSLLTAAVLGLLLWIGFTGPHDPAENLLPLSVWTLWWVVLVLLHVVLGNLWRWLNPVIGLHRLLGAPRPLAAYPQGLDYWPAVAIFLAFAWFQLVYPAPEDPPRLAAVVSVYAAGTLVAVVVCGPEAWLGRGDPFAVFMTQLAAAAPLSRDGLRWPGQGLLSHPALPVSGTLFVLLTLSAISFDGFSNTFLWLSGIGVNPLDYPGRTSLMTANTLGLLLGFALLASAFLAAIALGKNWSGTPPSTTVLAGRLVLSLIPISIAYHFAHYLGDTLVNLQYVLKALDDPFETGASWLGLGEMHVTASFLNTAAGTTTIFTLQVAAVLLGHVIAVVVAHAIAVRVGLKGQALLRFELPLALLMVGYTAFGLWLLATPTVA